MNLLQKSRVVGPEGLAVNIGLVILRVEVGLMIFYVHGLHKLEGGIAYARNGTPWQLVADVTGMHFPAPVASAWVATIIQFVCSLFIIAGFFTRLNAVLLAGALSGAILQNVLAGRDPQLAILYTLVVVSVAIAGGGRYSLDARCPSAPEEFHTAEAGLVKE
jgi:uncharacterized membrane protein YphA (DoxX/SURF4 family)